MNAKPSNKKWIIFAAFSVLTLAATAYFAKSMQPAVRAPAAGVTPPVADDWIQRAQQGGGQPAAPTALQSTGLSEDSRKSLALLINISGQLCARVTSVSSLGSDVYNVSCVRYRDGTGSAVYEVNLKSGLVR